MTTIAATRGVIAADRRCDKGGEYAQVSAPKLRRYGSLIVGVAGDYTKMMRFFEWVAGGMRGRAPATRGIEILAAEGGQLQDWDVVNGVLVRTPVEGSYAAIGSGEDVAKGAMYAGAGAVTAVLAAIEHDPKSGNGYISMRYRK